MNRLEVDILRRVKTSRERRGMRQARAFAACAGATFVAMMWFIAVNTGDVRLTLWWRQTDAPMWIVVGAAGITGGAIASALTVLRERHRRR